MKARLAIYDMDRTITRRATYTPFLVHAASRLAPWRLALLPLVLLAMLAYVLKPIDRAGLIRAAIRAIQSKSEPDSPDN